MKIEGNRPNLESVAAQRTDRVNSNRTKQGSGAGATQDTDRVQVSEKRNVGRHGPPRRRRSPGHQARPGRTDAGEAGGG